MDKVCEFCRAKKFRTEPPGKVKLDTLNPPPEPLLSYMLGRKESKPFLQNIRRNKCKRKNQASCEGSSPAGNVEINKNTRVGNLPTAEVNLEDNTDGQTDSVIEVKTEADDTDVHLRSREGTSEDNSNELGHDLLDYVNEVKTEVDEIEIKEEELKETRHDGADYVSEVKTEVDEIDIKEEEPIEIRHDRADYISEVKTEPDDIDIEELGNPSPINSVHARKRRRLDIEDSSMDFTDAVNAMKSPLQEDEDSAFFNSLLPSVRSLNTDQKFKFRLKTVQLLQDIRNFFS